MTPAPCRKPTLDGPGPVRLADDIDRHPEDPRPKANHGPTLPVGFDHQPEAPAGARPQGGFPRDRTPPASIELMLHIDDLAELLSCSHRLAERMRSAGKVFKPDIHTGRCPEVEARHDSTLDRQGRPPMTTGDDDRREPITAVELIRDYGRGYYLAALAYSRHHHDESGEPYWTADEWHTVVGLIEIEGRARS